VSIRPPSDLDVGRFFGPMAFHPAGAYAKNNACYPRRGDGPREHAGSQPNRQASIQGDRGIMQERLKALNCLYKLSEIISQHDQTLDAIMRRAVALIPPAFANPETVCARIDISDTGYRTDNFVETAEQLQAEIVVNGVAAGTITVGTVAAGEEHGQAPFSTDEMTLVAAIAERLGKTVERSQALADLEESEQRFRILVENSLTGISIVQGDAVVYQNAEQERLLGPLPRSSIMGDANKIHPEDLPTVERLSRDMVDGKIDSMHIDFRLLPAGGQREPTWINCRANRVIYRKRPSILFNMMDMTQSKELEKRLIAQDKMASLGRVAAGIAHEIRNPLSGINIYLDTLGKFIGRGDSPDQIQTILRHLASASKKIESVIRRVMDFSKPSQPAFIVSPINRPVEEALKLTATTLKKSGIALDVALADGLPPCRIDPQQLEEVVLNLINNAADAMRALSEGKRIRIVSGREGAFVALRILDSGPGIDLEDKQQIFDPFFTTKSDSTGIGLSICKRILADHGGRIDVRESLWGGAEFVLLLPIPEPGDPPSAASAP
jgi:PAS domain S-box-containing protein